MNIHDTSNLIHIAQALHQVATMPEDERTLRYGAHGVTLLVQRGRELLAQMAEELPCVHSYDPDGVCDWCGALNPQGDAKAGLRRVAGETGK